MDILIKLIQVVGAIITVQGLWSVVTGFQKYFAGQKNDNPQQMDQGINAMVSGGAMALISGGVTTAIVTALGQIKF